jgi:hypothetical protein
MITELTQEQIAKFEDYVREGIRIGLQTGAEFDENLVRMLTDRHRVTHGLEKATNFIIEDSPFAAAKKYNLSPSDALFGQHDINWLMFYKFFNVELGLKEETAKVMDLLELANHVGWMWMSSDTTIVTRRPVSLSLVPKNSKLGNYDINLRVLHNENDMAIKYKDGTGVYMLNGIRIPKSLSWIITTPAEELNLQKVLKIENTEIRTEALKKVGIDRAFEKLEKASLHKETITIPQYAQFLTIDGANGKTEEVVKIVPETSCDYELFSVQIGAQERIYLTSKCPSSGKPFYEAVPPQVRTVRQALNWRENGEISDDYVLPEVRT